MIVSSKTIADVHTQGDGRRYILHVFTDHLGRKHETAFKKVSGSWTETEFAADRARVLIDVDRIIIENELQSAIAEGLDGLPVARIPEYQTQQEFDRRVVGRLMMLDNLTDFAKFYTYYTNTIRAYGANNNARADNLGIDRAIYTQIANKFDELAAITATINNQRAMVWQALPEGF